MKHASDNPKLASARLTVAYGCAVLLPCLVLRLTVEPGTATLGVGHAPFGWYGMALVQSLALLPIDFIVAASLARKSPKKWRERPPIWPVLAGAALFVLVLLAAPGKELARPTVSLPQRLAVQIMLATLVQLPWCFWAALDRAENEVPGLGRFLLAGAIAVLLPWFHATALIERETRLTGDLLKKMQFSRAWPGVVGLSELGSTAPIAGAPPWQARQHLERTVATIRAEVAQPLSAAASVEDRLHRARNLAIVDRLDDALTVLEPLHNQVPALLLAATICMEQGNFDRSDELYRESLNVPYKSPDPDKTTVARVEAYDGMAYNARARGNPAQAEAVYHEGMTELPQARAYFLFQLGRHYHLAGKPADAVDALQRAVSLESSFKAQAAPLLEDIMEKTPSCLLRR